MEGPPIHARRALPAILFLAIILTIPASQVMAEGFTGFDGSCPNTTSFWLSFVYTSTGCDTGGRGIVNCLAPETGKCYLWAVAGSTTASQIETSGGMCGGTGHFNFRFMITSLPASGNTVDFDVSYATATNNVPDTGIGLRITNTGAAKLVTINNAGVSGTGNAMAGITIAANTFYDGSVYATADLCATTTGSPQKIATVGSSASTITGAWSNAAQTARSDTIFSVARTGEWSDVQLKTGSITGAQINFAGDATASIPAGRFLAGFDSDPFSGAVLSRLTVTATGKNEVQGYDPVSLATIGSTESQGDCSRLDGVTSFYERDPGTAFVGYLACASTGSANALKIRSGDLTPPNQGATECTDWCDANLLSQGDATCTGSSTQAFPPNAGPIGAVAGFPLSWKRMESSNFFGNNHALIGFSYSNTVNGNIGVWVIQQRSNNADQSCGLEMSYGSSVSQARQICNWRYGGQDYMVAVGQNTPLRVWKVNAEFGDDNVLLLNPPTLTITEVISLTGGSYSNVYGVGCGTGRDLAILQSNGNIESIQVLNAAGGGSYAQHWVITGGTATARGIALSDNNAWFEYVSGSSLKVGKMTDGSLVASLALPTGTFKEARISYNGQAAYAATTTKITRYVIYSATTITPQADGTITDPNNPAQTCQADSYGNCLANSSGTTTAAPNGIFGPAGAYDITGGGDSTKGGMFLTIVWVLAGAALGSTIIMGSAQGRIWGAGVGAVLFFAMLVLFGNVPPLITFLVVLLAIAAIGFRIRSGKSSDGG